MTRMLVVGLCILATVLAFGVTATSDAQAQATIAPQAGGGCGCPKTKPVCCTDCNGQFAYCARHFGFCPECPAP